MSSRRDSTEPVGLGAIVIFFSVNLLPLKRLSRFVLITSDILLIVIRDYNYKVFFRNLLIRLNTDYFYTAFECKQSYN